MKLRVARAGDELGSNAPKLAIVVCDKDAAVGRARGLEFRQIDIDTRLRANAGNNGGLRRGRGRPGEYEQ